MQRHRCLRRLLVPLSIVLLATLASPRAADAHACVGKTHYQATGKLNVALGGPFSSATGLSVGALAGVEVKLKRPGVRGELGAGPVTETESDGRFVAHGCFPRDSNGVLPGGQDIDIALEARFDTSRLQVRDPQLFQGNWHAVTQYSTRGGGSNSLGAVTYGENTINVDRFTTHAEIWWLYDRELRNFEDNEQGLPRQLTVTFPHSGTVRDSSTSYAVTEIFLSETDGPRNSGEPATMLHELLHIWHGQILRGNTAPVCLFDGHHNPPTQWNSARCSGFTEGLAEAVARRFMFERYGAKVQRPVSQANLISGTGVSYPITSLTELERSDEGWENFFRYLFVRNEWRPNGLVQRPECNATDVPVFELLKALDAANFSVANPRVSEVLEVLVEHVDGFSEDDSAIYQAVADPGGDLTAAYNELCGGLANERGDASRPRIREVPPGPGD